MRETSALSIVVFVTYVAAALGVTNAFPFSTFPMYSRVAPSSAARLVVKDESGAYHEIRRYRAWSCEPELRYEIMEKTLCPDGEIGQPAGYLSQEALDYIRSNAAEGGEPIELVIHTWRLDQPTPVELDCPVARCWAVRK